MLHIIYNIIYYTRNERSASKIFHITSCFVNFEISLKNNNSSVDFDKKPWLVLRRQHKCAIAIFSK